MGNQHSRPEDRLRFITREVNSLKASLRTSPQNVSKAKKEFLIENLAHHSSEVSSLNGKVKRKIIDETLKNISEVMEKVLKMETSELDGGAVESHSFVNVPLNTKRSSSLGSLKSSRKTREATPVNRNSLPTLRDIEAKVNELKTQIGTAINNRDTKQLRIYQQTIIVLAEQLEMIHVETDTPLEQRKASVDKKIVQLYQKVMKSLNELKREDILRNSSKQQRKESAMKDLSQIETHLAQNESLLDKLTQEKNASEFPTIRNNIVAIRQELAKVEIIDNDVKDRVVLLSQKLTETVKNLDRTMAKKEFDSKFNTLLNNYERINRNFDLNKNAFDTLNNLEGLRKSIQNLEEINDATKNHKKALLQKVNDHYNEIDRVLQKQSDQQIVEKLVEDNVVLRKKVVSSDKEHTVIDQFVSHWNKVKANFDINAYSVLSLLRIDGVLEEMQQDINDLRIGIANKCDTNPPTWLSKKHSQSVPRLNTRKSYGSNRSLDQTDNTKIIKAKAKLYNLSTPELQNVEKQQQNYVNSRFSKIEEIKLQVHYIKEKINVSHNKKLLREKLEQYLKSLEEYNNDSNRTVQNNANLVSNEIMELIYKTILIEMKEQVYVLSKRVSNFNGTKYDREYEELKDNLLKIQINLEGFNIPELYDQMIHEKGEVLDELRNNLETLQEKGSYYRKNEDEKVKQIKSKLHELSDKVKRFSGTYKGVYYNNIERELNRLLLDVQDQADDKVSSSEIAKETERLLKILEQRSSLAQSFKVAKPEETQSEEQIGMNKIKRDLYNIKREIDRTDENNVDAFIGLQSRLDLVYFELSQISARSNENLSKEKEICSNEAQTLKNVVVAKVALGQQPMVHWPERDIQTVNNEYPKNDINKVMEQFEGAFSNLKRGITEPTSEQDVHKYYKLVQDIKNLMDELSKYRFMRGSDLYIRQNQMLNEMQLYANLLEKGAIDIDYVLNIERTVNKLENLLDSGEQQDLKTMALELQAVQKRLQEHKFNTNNETLANRKISVQQKTDGLEQKLKELQNVDKELMEYTKKIDDIERKVGTLLPQITSFIGLKRDNKYYELNETTVRQVLILDSIFTDNPDLQKRRIRLLKDLHSLGKMLEERAEQTQEVVHLEQSLDEVSTLIDNFAGGEDEIKVIQNKMNAIKKHLEGLRVIADLIIRKNACSERYSVLYNKIMTLLITSSSNMQSSGYSSRTSTSYTTMTKKTSTGTSSKVHNFLTKITNGNSKIGSPKTAALAEIEKEVNAIEAATTTTGDIRQLQEYDDALTEFTIKVGKLNYTKDSPEYPQVYQLYQKIEDITNAIEGKMQEHDKLQEISNEVDELANKMDTPLTHDQINQLDERLIQLQIALGKMNSAGLKAQLDGCMLRIILCLQKISEFRASVINTPV